MPKIIGALPGAKAIESISFTFAELKSWAEGYTRLWNAGDKQGWIDNYRKLAPGNFRMLDPVGTPFQRAVWDVLRTIPYGSTMSYGEQARRLGDPNKARAVGAANGKNPISIVVPCHRVVGANGSLTGFAGGLATKAWLLEFETGLR